jgi:putative FmdB family regulatory protein
MAFYNYKCEKCDKEFDVMSSISDMKEQAECPTCGQLSKMIYTSCNFKLKGDGFYTSNKDSSRAVKQTTKVAYDAEKIRTNGTTEIH